MIELWAVVGRLDYWSRKFDLNTASQMRLFAAAIGAFHRRAQVWITCDDGQHSAIPVLPWGSSTLGSILMRLWPSGQAVPSADEPCGPTSTEDESTGVRRLDPRWVIFDVCRSRLEHPGMSPSPRKQTQDHASAICRDGPLSDIIRSPRRRWRAATAAFRGRAHAMRGNARHSDGWRSDYSLARTY